MDATALNLRTRPSATPARESLLDLRFRKTFEAAAIGLGICDFTGQILEANIALARLLGYDRENLARISLWSLKASMADAAGSAGGEFADASSIKELVGGERCVYAVERLWRRRDGAEFWGRLTASVARGESGEPEFLVALLEDASERRRIEEHLRQSEKMEAIGRLAGGVAHDFNNLLTGILLYSDLLLEELPPDGLLHRYVAEVHLATEQGAALTRQLLAVARKDSTRVGAIDLNEVVAGIENFLQRLIGERIELTAALDPAAGTVVGDAAQMRQIVLNLVLNARDALGRGRAEGGKIRMSTRRVEWPRGSVRPPARPVDDRRSLAILLAVEDNGCGMSGETRAHLFEPFFTTKKAGEGTGIGLGTVQRIVGELGGTIEVASDAGSGTRIEIFLPAAEGAKRPGESLPVDSPGGEATMVS